MRSAGETTLFKRCTDLVLWLAHVRSSTVLPPPETSVGADAARLLYGWLRDPLLCYPPPTLLLEQMLPVFYTVRGAIIYGSTPPYTTVGADAGRFFLMRLAARSSTALPPPTLLLGQMLPVSYTVVSVFGDPSLCFPPTLHLGLMLPVLVR